MPDSHADPRFADNPLATGDANIRFYAGVPLTTSEGLALGSLCVIDQKPGISGADQQTALRVLGNQISTQLELKRHITLQEQLIAERKEQKRACRQRSPNAAGRRRS